MNNRLRYLPYPPTSLPIRDLFVLEHVSFSKETRLMEIGVGCGETTARLAIECGAVTGVDVSESAIKALAYLKRRFENLELVCADAASDVNLQEQFDVIVSCDTLEHVNAPERFFEFIFRHLDQEGAAHVLFPNEFPPAKHGVTHFESEDALRSALGEHFTQVAIFRAELCLWPKLVVAVTFGWMQRLRGPRKGTQGEQAQCFDETRFFKRQKLWRKLSPIINLYWFVMLALCRLGGKVYELTPVAPEDFEESCGLYVRLKK